MEKRVVAVAVARNTEGKLLCQKRINSTIPDADNKWEFPGGEIEDGETPEQTAVRECLEETNCKVEIIRFLPFPYTQMWTKGNGETFQVFIWFFEAKHIGGEPKSLDNKSSEVGWFTKEEAKQLDGLSSFYEALKYID